MSRRLLCGLAATVAIGGGAVGCSRSSSPNAGRPTNPITSIAAPSTSTANADTTLRTPDTLADGSFPSVLDPRRDGSLRRVRVEVTVVAHAQSPMALIAWPGHPDRLLLAERAGTIHLVTINPKTHALRIDAKPLADLSSLITVDGEMGLLNLAFNRAGTMLYLSYTVHNGDSRIDEAPVRDVNGTPRIGRRTHLIRVDQMGTNFHKGGGLAVDDHDRLLIGFGDGGPQDDAKLHAQNPTLLLGKILRIDPSHPAKGRPYSIPPDNPKVDNGSAASPIVVTGLRNPWRFSIDPANGDLWIGDVGQDKLEEIDRLASLSISAGTNLGWSGFEGTSVFAKGRVTGPTVPPIFELAHRDRFCAVTGGVVYRGRRIAGLRGAYLFSDLCRAGIRALRATTPANGIGEVTDERTLAGAGSPSQVISFATDAAGEVYLLSLDGSISRLDPAT